MPRKKLSTDSIMESTATRNSSKLKDIDSQIKLLEVQIADLKEQKKQILIAENSEKLIEINDLISESGLSMAQVKALIKEKSAEPKKPRGRKKVVPEVEENKTEE